MSTESITYNFDAYNTHFCEFSKNFLISRNYNAKSGIFVTIQQPLLGHYQVVSRIN
jgi:hypothetical protein